MAKSLATTGHIVFNGWSEPTVGIQAYWGALIIRLFGWSYQVLRLSMFPWSIALALMTYATARLLKLPVAWAAFATLAFCLSPLLLPLETSFMTDVPSTFFVMLSTYAAARAATDGRERSGLAWMAVALVSAGCGSSIRQSNLILLPVIVCIPAAFRRSRTFLLWSAGLGAAASILCAVMVWHFLSQPHTHSLRLMSALRLTGQNLGFTIFRIFVLLASTVLFCAPIFAGALKEFKPGNWRIGGIGCAVSALYLLATHFWLNTLTLVPYGGVVTAVGVGLDETFLGGRPVVLPGRLVIFVTVLALTSLPFLIRSAPSINARYGIGLYPVPGATAVDVTSQDTALWLPPFHANARVFLLERPNASK